MRVTMGLMIAKSHPGIYIPTLYFAEGLPYTLVMMVSGVFFKNLGADNIFIGLTSWLSLPWILKFASAPLVDTYSTKRQWIIYAQYALATAVGILAFCSPTPVAVLLGLFLLTVIAAISAQHDVAIDGYYLDVLNKDQQSFYVGVRGAAYKMAWLFGSGGLVLLAGLLQEKLHWTAGVSWVVPFLVAAICLGVLGLFHQFYLPPQPPLEKQSIAQAPAASSGIFARWRKWLGSFKTYFAQPGIVPIVIYIVTFRLGDALMLKQAPLFLMDKASKGGLEIPLSQIGIINGTVGMLFLLAGGIVGGVLIAKQGLRKWFWPLGLLMNGALPLYWLLAYARPGIEWVYVVNSIEQLVYGLGNAAYTVFLLTTIRNAEYRATHYAIATAMMALGVTIPQSLSGFMQASMGYANFFLVASLLAIPGLLVIPFLPFWQGEEDPTKPSPDKTEPAKGTGEKAASR